MKFRTIVFALAALVVAATINSSVAEAGRRCGGCHRERCHKERCGLFARRHCGPQETHCVTCTVSEKQVPYTAEKQVPVQAPVGKHVQGPPSAQVPVGPSHPTAPTVGNPSVPRQDLNAPPVAPAR